MVGYVIANVIVAAVLAVVYAYLRYARGWFQHDHLKVPEWVTLISGPIGLAIPATKLAIDGMLIGAVIYFGNEAIYQRWGYSPLGWLIQRLISPMAQVAMRIYRWSKQRLRITGS